MKQRTKKRRRRISRVETFKNGYLFIWEELDRLLKVFKYPKYSQDRPIIYYFRKFAPTINEMHIAMDRTFRKIKGSKNENN